jgi:hypothetical protein
MKQPSFYVSGEPFFYYAPAAGFLYDETLANYVKRKQPRTREWKKQGASTKCPGKQAAQKRQATRRKGNH